MNNWKEFLKSFFVLNDFNGSNSSEITKEVSWKEANQEFRQSITVLHEKIAQVIRQNAERTWEEVNTNVLPRPKDSYHGSSHT